jgi:alpha-glucosidase
LALAAIYYSPLQTLYWYDKPEHSADEPELEFWRRIPVSWDESRVLHGMPGQYVTMARRNGDDWYVGTITNNESRELKIPLDFLPKGRQYLATIYADDPRVSTKTKVGLRTMKVDSRTAIDARLLASGGQAIWLRPAR